MSKVNNQLPAWLDTVLNNQPPTSHAGHQAEFSWQWLAEGVICLTPSGDYHKTVILSAGIHGNETAPIELLARLYQDLGDGQLPLRVRLLLVLGNPAAIRTGHRFIDYDLNRLFGTAVPPPGELVERARAATLQAVVAQFFAESDPAGARYHYDLHTAIRDSLFPTFALLPYQTHAYDATLLAALEAAELDALVYHNTLGSTFTQLTSTEFAAASVTLELGKAKPFNTNELSQFAAIDQVLRAIVSAALLPNRVSASLRVFRVVDSIIKTSEDFVLNLSATAPNFSRFAAHAPIAIDQGQPYLSEQQDAYVLFPNPNVAKGLRAGLVLTEVGNEMGEGNVT